MIIADSKYEWCIKRLMNIIEKEYPGIPFKVLTGRTSRIEVPDNELDIWEASNKGIFARIRMFCDGYTIGWEDGFCEDR